MNIRFALAPMAELSHRPMRELIESFRYETEGKEEAGASEYFSEMISAPSFIAGGPFEAWYADAGPCPGKLVYQLVGADAGELIKAAALLDKTECLGIDINMGCSAPAITRLGAGVRWMADAEKAADLVSGLRRVVKRRLSVKLRTGFSDDFEYLLGFCRRLEEEGADLITLHARTAKEKFKRRSRWEYIIRLREALSIPVAGNGDITSAEDAVRRAEDCDMVMIGRAAVREPWIFARAKTLGLSGAGNNFRPVFETGLRFLELLAKYQPREFYISRARRFFGYFCDNLKWGNYLKNLLNREEDLPSIEKTWKAYFAEHKEEEAEAAAAGNSSQSSFLKNPAGSEKT